MATKRVWISNVGVDEAVTRVRLVETLVRRGMEVFCPTEKDQANFGLISFERVTDEVLSRVNAQSRDGDGRVIAVAFAAQDLTNQDIWRLLQAGAADVIEWNHFPDPAAAITERFARWTEVDGLIESQLVQGNLVGTSQAWLAVLREVIEVAHYTDISVLIIGESGTGKELIARLIHTLDNRPSKGDLVVLDCATVVPELSGSEFFGHERGAFTHALNPREGAFAQADRGTLFLDEVGELPTQLQAELLRVVQERTYKRLGSNTWKKVNFRLVCATNRPLEEDVERGVFRRDLYFRLAGWICRLPPLRGRREDILPLARHFLEKLFPNRPTPEMDPVVRDYLVARDYPGNVRELRHLIARMASRHVGNGPITAGDLPPEESTRIARTAQTDWRDEGFTGAVHRAPRMGITLKKIREGTAELAIRIAVEQEGGNLQRASRKLGITDRALQMRQAANRQGNGEPLGEGPDTAMHLK